MDRTGVAPHDYRNRDKWHVGNALLKKNVQVDVNVLFR